MKKTKRSEVNHLSDHPENLNDNNLEDESWFLLDETKKKWRDMELQTGDGTHIFPQEKGDYLSAAHGCRNSGEMACPVS